MIISYLIVALRVLKKNWHYSVVNIFGLTVSMTCCLIIYLYVSNEISYDKFHEHRDRIFRYIPRSLANGTTSMQTWTAAGLAPLLVNSFPHDVERVTRFYRWDENPLVKHGDQEISLDDIVIADSSFFEIFSYSIIRGDERTVLNRPMTIALARSVADINFPGEDPVGKVLRYANKYNLEITGVFEDVPSNSHLQFTSVVSILSMKEFVQEWGGFDGDVLDNYRLWNYSTYVLASESSDIEQLQAKVTEKFYDRHSNGNRRNDGITDWLQPVIDIHFTKGILGDKNTGDRSYLLLAIALGVIIIFMTCFNFSGSSMAMTFKRGEEIGVRKSMGAASHQVAIQFLLEAAVLILIALVIAFILAFQLLPQVSGFLGFDERGFGGWDMALFSLTLFILIALLAGSYPAFSLSRINPSSILRNSSPRSVKAVATRWIVVFQFASTIFLLICSWVVSAQLSFLTEKNLGFSKDAVVIIKAKGPLTNYEVFKQGLLQNSQVAAVTRSNQALGNFLWFWRYSFPNGEVEGSHNISTLVVDDNYLDFMEIELKQGRALSNQFLTDHKRSVVVNEAFVKEFKLSTPLETVVHVASDTTRKSLIVGVVSDFYFQPLHEKIKPMVVCLDDQIPSTISVKLSGADLPTGLKLVEKEWRKYFPDKAFNYKFLDDHLADNYATERRASILLRAFSAIAFSIATLGIIALTVFVISQRKKEISIRKVLGANVGQVIKLFSNDIVLLIIVSYVIAVPLSWLASNHWLQNFANKTTVNPLIFILPGIIVITLAFSIIGVLTIRVYKESTTKVLQAD